MMDIFKEFLNHFYFSLLRTLSQIHSPFILWMDFLYCLCVTVKTLLLMYVDQTCAWCLWNSEEGIGSHEIEVKGSCEPLYGWNVEEQEVPIQWQARKPVSGAKRRSALSGMQPVLPKLLLGTWGMVRAAWTLGYYLG